MQHIIMTRFGSFRAQTLVIAIPHSGVKSPNPLALVHGRQCLSDLAHDECGVLSELVDYIVFATSHKALL